jgi:quercetin dioxygenase-like cupin family protein
MNLTKLINYQSGSIVSRTIIDKDVGTVTLFAFDKDQGLSEHTAPYDALIYILEGKVEAQLSRNKILVKKGEILIMPANKPHALKAIERLKMLLIMIKS